MKYYITNLTPVSQKRKQTQIKGKQRIFSRNRKKLVHNFHISIKFSWKEGDSRRI